MAWNQLTEWASPWPDDPDLRVCFGRDDDGRVMVVQHRQGSEIYSHQILTAILVAEAPLPLSPVEDRPPKPAEARDETQDKAARDFWKLSTPAPAAWTGAPAEAEGVEPPLTPARERTFPHAAPADVMETSGPLTMFYAETPFARQEPKRRSSRVVRWSVRIIGLLVLLVFAYLIWAGVSRAGLYDRFGRFSDADTPAAFSSANESAQPQGLPNRAPICAASSVCLCSPSLA